MAKNKPIIDSGEENILSALARFFLHDIVVFLVVCQKATRGTVHDG